jgi:hypothetical protein
MAQSKSFYDIVSNYVIDIPIIQREYAQGRTTENVKAIRRRFVDDLIQSITKNEELHLGFVYGKIEGKDNLNKKILNKEAVSSILEAVKSYADNLELRISATIEEPEETISESSILKFIPLDGQQRLTTLFILNWYLYFKGAKSIENKWLNHFKYTNRKSALSFCKELVKLETIKFLQGKQKKDPDLTINEIIKNSAFYLKKWSKDPTVSGMLEMLLSIEKRFSKDKYFDFSKIKIEDLPFKFDFMDLDSLKQTDELYVKMNSRGKQLSDYEHFKSWLQEKHKETSEQEWIQSFWKKLDTVWLNYFWQNIDSSFNSLDNFYYNFIKNLALTHFMATNQELPFEKLKELYGLIRNSEAYNSTKISYISLDKYSIDYEIDDEVISYFIFNIETLKFIEKTFDSLIHLEDNNNFHNLKLDNIICKPFFVEQKLTDYYLKSNIFTPTLWNSVFHYAFFLFYNDRDSDDYSVVRLQEWLRFIRNIVYNTQIQSPENFNNAIKQINKLSSFKFKISEAVLNKEVENTFFDNSQFEEEKVKLELLSREDWNDPNNFSGNNQLSLDENKNGRAVIIYIENHPYFYGQIKFLLDFSIDDSGTYNLQEFIRYSTSIYKLYKQEIRTSNKKLLERFLLCEDFYLPSYKSDYIFCSGSLGTLRTKNENWRQFFKGNKILTLKNAVDKLNGQEITSELLLDFINEYLKNNKFESSDWKYLFLKYPQAISYCKESAIRWNSENDIRLLKGFPITAYHAELRTYCFYLQHKSKEATNGLILPMKFAPFSQFCFFEEKNTDGHPGFSLNEFSFKDKPYQLDIRYSKSEDKFELCFYHKTNEIENRESDIDLDNEFLNFKFDNEFRHYFKLVAYDSLEDEIENLCNELDKIKALYLTKRTQHLI